MAHRTPPANEPEREIHLASDTDGPLWPDETAPAAGADGPCPSCLDRASTPFAAQHGRQLLLLDEERRGWVMAELHFDADRCRYVEIRRATYDSPREAAGALLSRALPAGDEAVERTAEHLLDWIGAHRATSLPAEPPDAD